MLFGNNVNVTIMLKVYISFIVYVLLQGGRSRNLMTRFVDLYKIALLLDTEIIIDMEVYLPDAFYIRVMISIEFFFDSFIHER